MGKGQTSSRGSTKAFLGGGRSSRSVGKTLRVTKETQTAQGHRRSTKGTRASVRIAGSRWRQHRAQGLQTSEKAVSPLRFGHRAHKVGYGKVGNAMMQE